MKKNEVEWSSGLPIFTANLSMFEGSGLSLNDYFFYLYTEQFH